MRSRIIVNRALTMFLPRSGVERQAFLWQCGTKMARQTSRAGGCMMAAAILVGAGLGAALGEPSRGIIAGLVAAVVLALFVWLSDRR